MASCRGPALDLKCQEFTPEPATPTVGTPTMLTDGQRLFFDTFG